MTLHQVPDLWFSDGGVVLQAGNSLFRVYQGILSAQSSVFADMFSLAQSGNEVSDKYEDCPLIVMHDDENEAEDFLRSIFDRSYLQDPDDLKGYEHLVGVLRLSHKYNCSSLKHWTLQRFTNHFFVSADSLSKTPTIPGTVVRLHQHLRFRMITVCIETESLWLIPHLLALIGNEGDIEKLAVEEWRDRPLLLIQFLQGFRRHSAFLHNCFRSLYLICLHDRAGCQRSMIDIRDFAAAQKDNGDPSDQGMPFGLRDQISSVKDKIQRLKSQICNDCFQFIQGQFSVVDHLWNKLPEIYGFPKWEELEDMKARALGQSNWNK